MLTVIVNHRHNANALALKDAFTPHARTVLVDSGSVIEREHAERFDLVLPNVYYSGLFNAAFGLASPLEPREPLLFICSDVRVPDARRLVERVDRAFREPWVEVYAPASRGSSHRHARPQQSPGLRKVSFVEGFCFAATRRSLAAVGPIDVSLNRLGWGIDIRLGYEALRLGGHSVVDDAVEVEHPRETGYDRLEAAAEMHRWLATLPATARWYARFAIPCGDGFGHAMLRLVCRL